MNEISSQRPLRQKTIGILGGMSNQATGEYYRMLNEQLNQHLGGWDNGEIIIASVNFGNIQSFVREDRWDEAAAYLADKILRLEAAGVDVIACVSNTMHRVVEPAMMGRTTPFIHIAEAIILGCTEIMLLVGPEDSSVPIFDTTALHAEAAIEYTLKD
ncbi:aspartate/glutamate racemase family protein [Acetobacter fabarum]|uniref:aspartate/glutamate racemase family protein n=1 Tax=Acetobacter fabarum TaxID=483199 RepID=UPI0039ED1EFA